MGSQQALLDSIDARTKLVGSNKMEILLFSLGTGEVFGINVFKVREVSQTPTITKTPNTPPGVEGVISLRGNIIPVISLAKFTSLESAPENTGSTMIVTEFSRHTQGFLVHDVDRIIRVDWDKVKPPQSMLMGNDALITAITELPDGKLVSILDVEQILARAIGVAKDYDTPVVLMGYLNPIEVMGYAWFAQQAAEAGVDGVLTVDLPPEEAGDLSAALRGHSIDTVFLLAPTSPAERIQLIAEAASGFIYYVSLRGVTGASHMDLAEVAAKLKAIRARTGLPLGVGFGIGTPEAAAGVAEIADAVIVGSAIVKRMEELSAEPDKILIELPKFLAQLRAAMDQSTAAPGSAGGAHA